MVGSGIWWVGSDVKWYGSSSYVSHGFVGMEAFEGLESSAEVVDGDKVAKMLLSWSPVS